MTRCKELRLCLSQNPKQEIGQNKSPDFNQGFLLSFRGINLNSYSSLKVSTGLALAALKMVKLVVDIPIAKITAAEKIIGTMLIGIWKA